MSANRKGGIEVLDSRKWMILEAIIREYIMTAEPVGSRTLTRRYDFGVSAATIRNEMSDLEDLGYLEQPHTSAGRVPSDKGYRTFVNAILKSHHDLSDFSAIAEEVNLHNNKQTQIHDLLQETTKMLSRITHYTSLSMFPDIQQTIFQHLKLIPLSSKQVVAVLVTDSGIVHNQVFNTQVSFDRQELNKISEFLNDRLQSMAIQDIDEVFMHALEAELINRYQTLSEIFNLLYTDLLGDLNPKLQQVFLDGTSYMIDQPEFADINKLKTVMNLLEQRELLYTILNQNCQDIQITIGQENPHKEMQNCSIVLATYSVKERPIGSIGILGPTRMEYDKVISMVQFVANVLTNILSEQDE